MRREDQRVNAEVMMGDGLRSGAQGDVPVVLGEDTVEGDDIRVLSFKS